MLICLLATLQSVARIVLPVMISAQDGPALETLVSDEVMLFINAMFIALGALGFATAFGMWTGKRWGFVGTVALSAVTLAFDAWAVLTVQSSAAMGMVLPVAFIVYLALIWKDVPEGGRR